jgi:chromodomain-helicase-DNA-binding protein 4
MSEGSKNALPPVQESTGNSKDAVPSFEIVIPPAMHPEDYPYLPGHFEARCILAVDIHEPKFIVRLMSGERTTVSEMQINFLDLNLDSSSLTMVFLH